MSKIRVVLIEDHDLSRIGLSAALQQVADIEVVGEAANAHKGLQILTVTKPDVAIVDIGLPDSDGIDLTQQFKALPEGENTKVLILTMHNNEDSVLAAFAAGADSYSLKDVSLENLVQAIRLTSEGNSWIDPTIARLVLKQAKDSQITGEDISHTVEIKSMDTDEQELIEAGTLTERELDVLELIVAGSSNSDIAEKLHITIGTVKTHVRNILSKLCASDRTQAAVRALRSGLVE
ncbi:response regulator transcription factor [Spirulina sp. CS-785/01]|uniref:response regulator n=1 Tax=Spirulina sp. CS-785/01 TaxID=3021716 RepID=UPI00232DBB3C|nr:response regulator transcription factor [Spirulina sp. CS-785/01]MDB9312357.1 response regulator transcription factor [Spirulina sp. CS-785/01]